jgi:hypothetical protein
MCAHELEIAWAPLVSMTPKDSITGKWPPIPEQSSLWSDIPSSTSLPRCGPPGMLRRIFGHSSVRFPILGAHKDAESARIQDEDGISINKIVAKKGDRIFMMCFTQKRGNRVPLVWIRDLQFQPPSQASSPTSALASNYEVSPKPHRLPTAISVRYLMHNPRRTARLHVRYPAKQCRNRVYFCGIVQVKTKVKELLGHIGPSNAHAVQRATGGRCHRLGGWEYPTVALREPLGG